jgi:signal transduction histidine kinase
VTDTQARPARRVERDLQAVGGLAQAVLDGGDSDALLLEIARAAQRLVAAKAAMVVTIGGEPEVVTVRAVVGVSGGPLPVGSTRPLAGTPVADLVRRRSIVVRNRARDAPDAIRELMEAYEIGPVVAVPLATQSVARGVLIVGKATGATPFRQAEVDLAATFAHQAASAIHMSELRAAEAALTVDTERERIARDLHDGVVQTLYGLGMSLRASVALSQDAALALGVNDAVARLDDTIVAVREYIAKLEQSAVPPPTSVEVVAAPVFPIERRRESQPGDVIAALGDLAEASLAGRSLASVLAQLVVGVVERSAATFGGVATVNEGGVLETRATAGVTLPKRQEGDTGQFVQTLAGAASRRGRRVVVASPERVSARFRETLLSVDAGPVVAIPMSVRGRAFGGLVLGRVAGSPPFSRAEVTLIEAHAVQAAIALEFERVREELRRGVVVEERRRVGIDLDDRVIHSLFGIGLTLKSIERSARDAYTRATIRSAIDSIDRAIRDLRRYVLNVRPGAIDRLLDDELRALASDLVANTPIELTIDIDPAVSVTVVEAAGDIILVAREAISNVVQHAEARHCAVTLTYADGNVLLEVADDGIGLPDVSSTVGHGLRNLRSRARALGARVDIETNRPIGTVVRLTIPIH